MDLTAWALYALIAAVALGGAAIHYRRREPAGRGRAILGLLRGGAIAVLVLLLFDPRLPADGSTRTGTVVLVDGSLSMARPSPDGGSAWLEARAVIDSLDAARVVVFGAGEARALDAPGDTVPGDPESRLAPALGSVLESGARRVVVVTDGGIQDGAEAARVAEAGTAAIEVRPVGGVGAPNLGLAAVDVPAWLEGGVEATVRATVTRRGAVGADSARVRVRRGDEVIGEATVPIPPEGEAVSVSVPVSVAPGTASPDPVRLEVAVTPGGAMTADDVRYAYVRVAEEPAGVVLVSFRPDQEPRFLVPVLQRASGLPVRGWLRVGGDRYLRLGTGSDAGETEDEAGVRRAVANAELIVLHGLTEDAPGWALEAVARPRALVFPADPWPGVLPVRAGPARPGDWYPARGLPSSPVAPLLAGLEPGDAAPLTTLWTAAAPGTDFWTPLDVRLGRRNEPRPAVLAGTVEGRRLVVALGTGYWRWAFGGSGGRALYAGLWSALTGWLLESGPGPGPDAVRPALRVVARGEAIEWLVPGDADSLQVRLAALDAGGGAGADTVVAVRSGRGRVAAVPPGRYRYEASIPGPDSVSGSGELTVEAYSPELDRPAVPLRLDGGPAGGEERRERTGRPLHASPWPYAVVILLLCAEWVLRRRWGLR